MKMKVDQVREIENPPSKEEVEKKSPAGSKKKQSLAESGIP
jgi:hypothetical protein